MQEESNLQQHVNVFNTIIINLVCLGVKIDDKDKTIILMCSLLGSYDHLVITLANRKYTISLDVISAILFSHSQKGQNVEEGTQNECLY